MDGRSVLILGITLTLLPGNSAAQYHFLNATCAAKYRCPDVPGLNCSFEFLGHVCQLSVQDTPGMIPSAPKNFSVRKTAVKRDRSCVSGFGVSWIPPNDYGGTKLQGFEIRVTSISGKYPNMADCVRIYTTGTEWTQQLLESEIPFTFDCFTSVPLATYSVKLQSLPRPKWKQKSSENMYRTVTIDGSECHPPTEPTVRARGHFPGNRKESKITTKTQTTVVQERSSSSNDDFSVHSVLWIMVALGGTIIGVLLLLLAYCYYKKRKKQKASNGANVRPNNACPLCSDRLSQPPYSTSNGFNPTRPLADGTVSIATAKLGIPKGTTLESAIHQYNDENYINDLQHDVTCRLYHQLPQADEQTSDLGPSLETDDVDVSV